MRFPKFLNTTNIIKALTVVVLIVLGVRYQRYLNSTISLFINRHHPIAPLIFIVLCSIKPFFFFLPTMGLTIIAGVLFGVLWGTVYVVIGGVFSTALGFWFARWLGRDVIKRLGDIDKRIRQMDDWTGEYGRNTVLALRVFNMPWDVVSYWAGLSNIQFKDFYIASLIPLIPISFLYTYFGSKVFTPKSWGFIIPLLIMFMLAAIPFVRKRLKKKANNKI